MNLIDKLIEVIEWLQEDPAIFVPSDSIFGFRPVTVERDEDDKKLWCDDNGFSYDGISDEKFMELFPKFTTCIEEAKEGRFMTWEELEERMRKK